MKKIIITQRQDIIKKHKELRDSIDIQLVKFIENLGYMPILISNSLKKLHIYLRNLKPDGILLSGGGDAYKKDERSKIEAELIKFSLKKKIPLLGICRGAQQINRYFNGTQKKINNHVRKNHTVRFLDYLYKKSLVNSFHDYGFDKNLLSKDLKILGLSDDNIVEYFAHKKHKILGVMWHPERYKNIKNLDIKIFRNIFKK